MSMTYLWQIWYDLLNPDQGYDHAKFERNSMNSVHQKANIKVLVKSEKMSIISLEYVQKWKIMVYTLSTYLTIQQSFTLAG